MATRLRLTVIKFKSIVVRIRQDRNQQQINLLLLNLVIADLCVTFIVIPLEIAWNLTVSWEAGDLACRVLSFLRTFSIYASGFIPMCISLDRYFAVVKPFSIIRAKRRVRVLLCVAWVGSASLSLPEAFIFHVEKHLQYTWYEQCVTLHSLRSEHYELAYNIFGFFLMHGLPLTTFLYCYSQIIFRLRQVTGDSGEREDPSLGSLNLGRSSNSLLERAKRRTIKITAMAVIAYVMCWTPYGVLRLWSWFDGSSTLNLNQRLQSPLFLFACTNSCFNPFIYGWFHVRSNQNRISDIQLNSIERNPNLCEGN